jgi:DNA-directed RNA polymerase subunit RPC12/RpoP
MNKLGAGTNCPVCGKKRLLQMRNIVSSEEGSLMIYNRCPHCASAFIAVVSGSKERGLVVVETLTDLTHQEAMEIPQRSALTADAVLDIYQSI